MSAVDVREVLRVQRAKLRDVSRELERLSERQDEEHAWQAAQLSVPLDLVISDLDALREGERAPVRCYPFRTGKPYSEDAGGGFGGRTIGAIAACREAWVNADASNAPRLEAAIAWLVRAWLGTAGIKRVGVMRAVLATGMDPGVNRRLVSAVNLRLEQIDDGADRDDSAWGVRL